MAQDRPFTGILLMIGFCILAPLGDSIAKVLGGTIPLAEMLLVRFGVQAVLLVALIWWIGGYVPASARVLWLTLLRTILHIIGSGAMYASLRYLPLADALAIAFVMPFIMLLLGRTVLGEEVGPHRLAACGVGFAGTLLVIQPNFAAVGWPALLPLLVALVFALFMLVTRQVAKSADPLTLQALSGAMAVPILAVVVLAGWLSGIEGGGLVFPGAIEVTLLAAIGVIGTVAHLLMTWSLRFAPSATLAPVQYLEIPFATIIGWLVFRDLPNGLAAIGIAITIAAGLYVLWREHSIRPAVE
ncbi:MAG: DMT family transporter [Rhodobacteraceae bacterium]|nr:DMT family transporter [Paracoccaceae bacterium]